MAYHPTVVKPPSATSLPAAIMCKARIKFYEYKAKRKGPPKPRPLQFTDLPPELRDMIWEFSLLESRVFHVKQIRKFLQNPGERVMSGRLAFHNPQPPPAATAVCTESRRVAWRTGCVLFQHAATSLRHELQWFNPNCDVLYFDRNQRAAFNNLLGGPGMGSEKPTPGVVVPGLERVRHLALEWRWFMQDGSKALEAYSSDEMRPFWAAKMDRIYAYMPALRTIHYVLPMIRHQGGLPWGREPSLVKDLPIEFVDLPPRCLVPLESGFKSWEEVRAEFEKTLGSEWQCEDKKAKFGDGLAKYPPEVVGERLIRVGAPTSFEHSTVRAFE